MKFDRGESGYYDIGDTRVVKKFALFPITSNKDGRVITVWLETVKIKQRLCGIVGDWWWEDEEFVD